MRIAPPEAPKTGYMFGKGVYFADMISKSAPYACPDLSGGVGCYLLCEVALGETNDLTSPNHDADRLPKGRHSTKAVGREHPDPKDKTILFKNVEVPFGKTVNSETKDGMGSNEFIVYNTN
jgi:poly [ADP-ribose] polymerase